jgi:hypothetical protein
MPRDRRKIVVGISSRQYALREGIQLSRSAQELPPALTISISDGRYLHPLSSQDLFGISPISELFPGSFFEERV